MADYNVNMKQFNGTDYDNILPHSYLADTAEKLGGGAQSDIITQARNGLCQIATGSYVGNGVGSAQIYIEFEPQIIYFYRSLTVSAGNWNKYQYKNGVRTSFSSMSRIGNTTNTSYDYWSGSNLQFLIKGKERYSGSNSNSDGNGRYGYQSYYWEGFQFENGILTFYENVYEQSTRSISQPTVPSNVFFNSNNVTYYWVAMSIPII